MHRLLRLLAFLLIATVAGAGAHRLAEHARQREDSVIYRSLSPFVWLFDGVPVDATYLPSAVKSIQHVTVTSSSSTPTYTTITSVNAPYTTVCINGDYAGSNYQGASGHVWLQSATQVGAVLSGSGSTTFYAVVTEYMPQFIKQNVGNSGGVNGAISPGGGNVSLGTTVNMSKTLPCFQGVIDTGFETTGGRAWQWRLSSTTQIFVNYLIGDDFYTAYVGAIEFK